MGHLNIISEFWMKRTHKIPVTLWISIALCFFNQWFSISNFYDNSKSGIRAVSSAMKTFGGGMKSLSLSLKYYSCSPFLGSVHEKCHDQVTLGIRKHHNEGFSIWSEQNPLTISTHKVSGPYGTIYISPHTFTSTS